MQKVPFYIPSIGTEEIEEVVQTLKSGWLTTGPKTKQFECEFATYLQHRHAVAVNSCTAALHLALEAISLKAGQSVIVPTMTFAATAEVVRYLGARPILADCRVEDFNLDVSDAERRIQSALAAGQSVAAIMPVHYGGQIGDVVGVTALARRYHLKIIEDAAHCCPASFRETEAAPWQSVGTGADISCYSFYANKTITTGEGGMACTNNAQYADRMRMMSLHGISRDAWKRYTGEGSWYYEIIAPGFKYNMTDIAAAIGIQQLRKADLFHQRRKNIVGQYHELLNPIEEIILPKAQPNRDHSWHLFAIRLKLDRLQIDRAQFITELRQRGVSVSVHWMPLHMHPYYRETYGFAPQDLPTAASLYPEIITLPLYPDMSEGNVLQICDAIKDIVRLNRRTPVSTPREQ
jgi:dTDP-4-amino-4,6-dideoxygalactose transaminase